MRWFSLTIQLGGWDTRPYDDRVTLNNKLGGRSPLGSLTNIEQTGSNPEVEHEVPNYGYRPGIR